MLYCNSIHFIQSNMVTNRFQLLIYHQISLNFLIWHIRVEIVSNMWHDIRPQFQDTSWDSNMWVYKKLYECNECTQVYSGEWKLTVHHWTWLYMIVQEWTWVYISEHECFWVNMSVLISVYIRECGCTLVNVNVHQQTWVYISEHEWAWVYISECECTWV